MKEENIEEERKRGEDRKEKMERERASVISDFGEKRWMFFTGFSTTPALRQRLSRILRYGKHSEVSTK